MDKNLVSANFNMTFDNGNFIKNEPYNFKTDIKNNIVYVITEEGKKQEFSFPEFDVLFTLLKN